MKNHRTPDFLRQREVLENLRRGRLLLSADDHHPGHLDPGPGRGWRLSFIDHLVPDPLDRGLWRTLPGRWRFWPGPADRVLDPGLICGWMRQLNQETGGPSGEGTFLGCASG